MTRKESNNQEVASIEIIVLLKKTGVCSFETDHKRINKTETVDQSLKRISTEKIEGISRLLVNNYYF